MLNDELTKELKPEISERKLASVQEIREIKEHPNADSLLIAKVLGWDVIINKSENFKVGDKVIYFEIDSCLPVGPEEYEFLRKSSYKNSPIFGEVFKLKTIKLRGIVSQGLILPLQTFFNEDEIADMPVGLDISERLNIRKWEEPEVANIGGDAVGKRPMWIEKSSETRIQNETGLLDEFGNLDYYITCKIDGASHFIAIDDNNMFRFGSHNLELKPEDVPKQGSFHNFIIEHDLENKLFSIKNNLKANRLYIIGEWTGPRLQSNRLNLKKPEYYIFTISIDDKRVGLDEMIYIADLLGIKTVPIEERGKNLKETYPTIEALIERAGKNPLNIYPSESEGIVIRPVHPIFSKILKKDLSMKVINNRYLIKYEQ